MPGMDGLTGLALLRSDHPAVPIIVVSAAREAGVIRRAYEFGASAYIDKSASLDEIARIVRAVLAGEIFAPPEAGPPIPSPSAPPSSRRSNGACWP